MALRQSLSPPRCGSISRWTRSDGPIKKRAEVHGFDPLHFFQAEAGTAADPLGTPARGWKR